MRSLYRATAMGLMGAGALGVGLHEIEAYLFNGNQKAQEELVANCAHELTDHTTLSVEIPKACNNKYIDLGSTSYSFSYEGRAMYNLPPASIVHLSKFAVTQAKQENNFDIDLTILASGLGFMLMFGTEIAFGSTAKKESKIARPAS